MLRKRLSLFWEHELWKWKKCEVGWPGRGDLAREAPVEKLNQLTTTGGPHGRGGGAASESEQQWHNKQTWLEWPEGCEENHVKPWALLQPFVKVVCEQWCNLWACSFSFQSRPALASKWRPQVVKVRSSLMSFSQQQQDQVSSANLLLMFWSMLWICYQRRRRQRKWEPHQPYKKWIWYSLWCCSKVGAVEVQFSKWF